MSHSNVLITGTSHFVTRKAARAYYKAQGFTPADADAQLERGEIALGAPSLKEGQRCRINAEGRYVIEERTDRKAVHA